MKALNRLTLIVAGDTRVSIQKDHGELAWRSLADNGFVERTSVTSVGFRREISENSLLVVLPKAFSSSDARDRLRDPTYKREQIYQLIRVFKKIRRQTEFSLGGEITNEVLDRGQRSEDPVLDSVDAALRLRRDYKKNGLYVRKSPRQSINKPNLPLDWASTMRSSNAILNGRDVFFDSTVHKVRKHDISHPLCMLQIACLKEIFMLTAERNDFDHGPTYDTRTIESIRKNPKRFLRSLRSDIFDERGRFLLSAISSYLGEAGLIGVNHEIREELLCFTKDFEDIWEEILRDLMAPGLRRRTLPSGQWYTWPSTINDKGMQPEFDIRLDVGDSDLLIDAKDYRLINGAKWQGSTSDHYKQIIYRQLLDKSDGLNVLNILAFPGLAQGKLFRIRGCHRWKEIPDSRVFEITVDYNLAVKRWLREISMDIDSELISLLSDLREFDARIDTERLE